VNASAVETLQLPAGVVIVGDERLTETSGGTVEHVDPSTGAVQATFAAAGATEIDRAVGAAHTAREAWTRLGPAGRRDALLRLADVLVANAPELAAIRSRETGIPFRVPAPGLAVDWLRYYAGWADKLAGETIPHSANAVDYTTLEPYGAVGVLIPWNAPIDSIGMKVAPALAAGNTVVLKPSELAPFVAIRFGELCLEAGLPAGVVNVVPGAGETGAALVSHPGIGKISFTGGGATARRVLAGAAEHLTPVVLELGGKSANIVFADADLAVAAQTAVMRGIVALSGQACVLPTRLLVQDDAYDTVVEHALATLWSVRVGRPSQPDVHMGPVITEQSLERILGVVERAQTNGDGTLLAGGHRLGGDLAKGYFVEPTVFGDVDARSEVAVEELFGPVLSIIRFRDEAEAVEIANATRYGLGGLVFTRDVGRAHRVARAIDAGSIGVNGFPAMAPGAPFGGMKESGFGREGGQAGIYEFVRPKTVHVEFT
jgi:aldehyde dehydrogenase (NAD+)